MASDRGKVPKRLAMRAAPSNPASRQAAQPAGDFLWVNHEENSQDASSRAKQAFIRKRYHRLKKETEQEKFKTSVTPPFTKVSKSSKSSIAAVSDRCEKSQRPGSIKSELLVYQPAETGIVKAFPSLSLSTDKSMDYYLRHCQISLTIGSCDLVIGLLKQGPPTFEICEKWEHRVLTKSIIAEASRLCNKSCPIGNRFFDSAWSADIRPELQSIIKSFQQLILLFEAICEADRRLMAVENDYLLLLVHRLSSMPYEYSLKPLDEVIRVSILLYSSVRIWGFRGKPCMEYAIEGVRYSLEVGISLLEETAPELLFWMYFLGALGTTGLRCHQWLVSGLQSFARRLCVEDWASALPILQGYFFVSRHREIGKEFWESLFGTAVEYIEE
ncbi:hypothetical protein N7495_006647 [Penicillium taxi]|uniref:uncharacterized protein n=1 Tax=Penicillium taxi TaxID=168475 RepID=UPI0025456FA7|nr:uncharacterized protein N7495_006647 [Penicillium taxi]KAJ5894956.1 hypothetical protein N7495_006647 [Penicillium taxi]